MEEVSLCIRLVLSCALACYNWKHFRSSCIFSVLMLSFVDLVKLITHDVRLNCRCTVVFCTRLQCSGCHLRGAHGSAELRLCPSARDHCLAVQVQCGTPADSIIQLKSQAEIWVVCCPPCATLLGPVVNNCHLLGYKFLPEQPFLMKAGVWVYKVVSLWLGIWKICCFLVRNVKLFNLRS